MQEKATFQVERLNIKCVNHLAGLLKIPGERLLSLAASPNASYNPFDHTRARRPFQKKPPSQPRKIDNPLQDLSWAQKRINRLLLAPICFPEHMFGAIPKRSVFGNSEHHHGALLLVTIDVKQCFPSITNKHVYSVWSNLLGCCPPVAGLLTRLTTFERHLPQGAATTPLTQKVISSLNG